MVNAAACLSATVGQQLPDLLGPPGTDGSGQQHQPLPFIGCSILGADGAKLQELRAKAATRSTNSSAVSASCAHRSEQFVDRPLVIDVLAVLGGQYGAIGGDEEVGR
jgi:hypothetical protein